MVSVTPGDRVTVPTGHHAGKVGQEPSIAASDKPCRKQGSSGRTYERGVPTKRTPTPLGATPTVIAGMGRSGRAESGERTRVRGLYGHIRRRAVRTNEARRLHPRQPR
jgi:hypothetical protein